MLAEEVRARCAEIAASARRVTIHPGAARYDGGTSGLDPGLHRLDAPRDEVLRYVLILDAVNFGSGWFEKLGTDTDALTARLTARGTPWTAAELREVSTGELAEVLGLPARHRLTGLYRHALRDLGAWLREPLELGSSAQAFAARLPYAEDPGFHKRAQIAANDLVLAGVADFDDVDRLTVFADNMLPHVLRADGVLEYAPELAARIDADEELQHGSPEEVELRACAVHACEGLAAVAGVAPRTLDNWLWHRARALGGRPHRTCTTAY
ncbi:MAG: queuosine salvage family protein [Solirubrobacteraceae bacterium]